MVRVLRLKKKASAFLKMAHDGFLKASTDCFSMTLFSKELQSLIVRPIKLCWYLFVLAPTWMNFLGLEWPSALSPFK